MYTKALSQGPCTLSSIIRLVNKELGRRACRGKTMVRTIKSVSRSKITIFGGQTLVKSSNDALIPESKT